jgi:hypothetical protein
MGLLGTSFDDPQTMGNMALAAGMIRGDLGGGLLGYGQAQTDYLKNQEMKQQMQLRNLQLQQAQQEWQLQQPLLAAAVARLQGRSGPTVGQPGMGQPAIPPSSGPMGSGTFGIPVGGQQASAAPASPGGTMLPGVPDDVAMWNIGAGGIKSIPTLLNEYNKPTDFQKMLTAAGIDPASEQGRAMIQQNIGKQNYIAPVNARPGSILRDPMTNRPVAFNPHVPDGSTPSFDASGNVIGLRPLAGAYQAISNAENAKGMGQAEATPTVAYDASGNPVFSTKATDVRRAGGGLPGAPAPEMPPQPGVNGNFRGDPAQIAAIIGGIKDPQERANAAAALQEQVQRSGAGAGPLTPQQRPGTVLGQENAQNEVSKRWQALVTQNQEAQNTKSYLDSIKQLASKAAVGPFSDKLQFTNSLLALVGNERATDATTANNLLDKYSGQIVSRLGGSGGLATDSARAILQSAYPNAHMTKEAIAEAADNISGAQSMIQAKAGLLEQHANARNPAAYTKAEIQFDKNADPRLWQLKNMDAATAQKWLASQPPSVQADLRRRAGNLKLLGVL